MADIKMVLVVRKDLNMRKGKIAAQCGHAATGATLQAIFGSRLFEEDFAFGDDGWDIKKPAVNIDGATKEWLAGNFKKVCVSVDSEEELDRIADAANKAGINCCVIVDDGLTEFHGVKTKTCLALGPYYSEEIDKITGELKLL